MLVTQAFDVEKIRKDFPVLGLSMNGQPLVYLDNAATAQKPKAVMDRMDHFYKSEYSNIHRGVYALSQHATMECDEVREKCQEFLNAARPEEIIFVRGATEAVNLVAAGYGEKFLKSGDEIIISMLEHHANIVPWQRLAKKKGVTLKIIPINGRGELLMEEYKKLLTPKTKLVAVTQVSNALGTVTPVQEITRLAHQAGAVVLIDGAQAVPHLKVDVREIGCDFYCFSGHKVYGPTGIGVLYGRYDLLEAMDPYQTGGEMIEIVSFEKETTFAKPPAKFEAGTPAIAEIIGLGPALDYIQGIGLDKIEAYEHELLLEATRQLSAVKDLRIIGTAEKKSAVVSFDLEGVHPHDIGSILDQSGIAIRTGHHCAQPLMRFLKLPATARASFSFYNTKKEIEALVHGLEKVREIFK